MSFRRGDDGGHRQPPPSAEAFHQTPDDVVEDRGEEQPEDGDAEHPGEHCYAHRAPDLEAGAGGEHQRHDAHDESHRRHQHRPQPDAARAENRVEPRLPVVLPLPRELDDQDRVLARQPREDEEADLGEDVVVAALSQTPVMAQRNVIGTIRMTMSGSVQLSYCAASTT
jgi:hypothetical protein